MIFDDEDEDRDRARRRWNSYLAAIDAEIAQEARDRAKVRPQIETDIGKAIDQAGPLPPLVVDAGAETSRADREAIQAEQDRWTRWERMGR